MTEGKGAPLDSWMGQCLEGTLDPQASLGTLGLGDLLGPLG